MHISSMPPAASHAQTHPSPAQQARDLLPTGEDLTDQPFGKLVSMFARGEPIPPGSGDGITDDSQTAASLAPPATGSTSGG
jgi:hypothetical protein